MLHFDDFFYAKTKKYYMYITIVAKFLIFKCEEYYIIDDIF